MPARLVVALIALLGLIALPSFAEIYTEWLWFGETGYQSVFLKSLTTRGLVGAGVFAIAFAIIFWSLRRAVHNQNRPFMVFPGGGDIQPLVLEPRHLGWLAAGISTVVALFIAGIASSQWLLALQFLNATPFGEVDPQFNWDASFFIFTLPFLEAVRYLILATFVLSFVGAAAAYVMSGQLALTPEGLQISPRARQHLATVIAVLFLLMAAGAYLDMPRTLTTPAGIIHGASYVDVVARIPILRVLMVASVAGAVASAYAALSATTLPVMAAIGGYLIIWIGGGGVATLIQQLIVTPDEQRKEAPYIAHNIKATRLAFDLDAVEEQQVSGDATLTLDDIADNSETINNVRLWDHQPLLDTFGQIQEIRTYYEFASVDNDRYGRRRRVSPDHGVEPRAQLGQPPEPLVGQ